MIRLTISCLWLKWLNWLKFIAKSIGKNCNQLAFVHCVGNGIFSVSYVNFVKWDN